MMLPIPSAAPPRPHPLITTVNEKFVLLNSCTEFDVSLQYPKMGLENALYRCFVRESVYRRLLSAQSALPAGVRLCVLDAWRPLALQQELYNLYAEQIVERLGLQNASAKERLQAVAAYVSPPERNPLHPPVHTTGGAVDVTLTDENGVPLDMGTAFDDFSEASRTDYFETEFNPAVQENRRMLYGVMTGAGFTNLPGEWWHYDYGDRFWAYYNRCPARYGGVFTAAEMPVE